MPLQGFDPQAIARVFSTIFANYDRNVHELHLRSRPFPSKMQEMGRISFRNGGNGHQWPIKIKQHQVRAYTANTKRNFEALQPFKEANLPIAGYEVTDAMPERERAIAEASGAERLINYYASFAKGLEQSIIQQTAKQYFINGEASGNQDFWKGLGTFNQATQTIDSTATTTSARVKNNADIFYYPAGNYANLSMVLGAYGGAQESTLNWPNGQAETEFDFWAPVILNWSSTSLNNGGSTHTFKDQGLEALSLAMSAVNRNELVNGGPTHVFTGTDLFEGLKSDMRDKQRLVVSSASPTVDFGFRKEAFMADEGLEIVREYYCHPQEAFGVNFNDFEIRCVYDVMFQTQGPFYDEVENQHRVACVNLSTFKLNAPRNIFILRSALN